MMHLFSRFFRFLGMQEPACRLVAFDRATQVVAFQVKYSQNILQCSLSEAINDPGIIANLSSREACWLGGYYGRSITASEEARTARRNVQNMAFLLSAKFGRYQINFQNRDGSVGYFDKKTQQSFVEQPITVVSDAYIIGQFDSTQACYMGILAGISIEKARSCDAKSGSKVLEGLVSKKVQLRIVR
jgi:hypothetical protein